MPINFEETLNVVQQLSEVKHIKVAVKESFKGAGIVAGGAFAGSILGGPVGLVAGSLLGTALAYGKVNGKYQSVPYIIMYEMTEAQRRELADSVYNVIKDVDATDAAMLLKIIISSSSLESLVMHEITNFLTGQMGYSIQQS